MICDTRPGRRDSTQTRTFAEGGQLPKLDWLLAIFGLDVGTAPFNVSFLLALVAALCVWLLIWRTKLGYEMRTMGHSPSAARYAGMSPRRLIALTMSLCGMLAGLSGVILILGGPQYATLETEIYRQTAQLLNLDVAAALSATTRISARISLQK